MQAVEKNFNYFYRQDLLKLLNAFNQVNLTNYYQK